MNPDKYIILFSTLGERLAGFGGDEASRGAMAAAMDANPWFTESDILAAVEAIGTHLLQPDILAEWLGRYDMERCGCDSFDSCGNSGSFDSCGGKDIAVIMAGNIPLVGFSDLLCVIAAGDRCHLKMSGKDTALMEYVVELLRYIDPTVPIVDYREGGRYNAVIATGSDNTNRYFRLAFSAIPALLRGSRSSVAVLGGLESDETLRQLSGDVFRYSGLGCRNTSLIFVPENYDIYHLGKVITPATADINVGYLNNYKQNKALLSVKGEPFADFGCFLMQEKAEFPMNISSVNYRRYRTPDEVVDWLTANDSAVQCIATDIIVQSIAADIIQPFSARTATTGQTHPRAVPIGQAHRPYPWDYPDGRDVMAFLLEL